MTLTLVTTGKIRYRAVVVEHDVTLDRHVLYQAIMQNSPQKLTIIYITQKNFIIVPGHP